MPKTKKPKSSKKPAKKAKKSKSKEEVIPLNLPGDVYDFYKRVSKHSGVDMNTVIKVVIFLQVVATLEREGK